MENLKISASPHIRAEDNTQGIMLDVIIALIPVIIGAIYFFGNRAAMMIAICAAASAAFEYAYQKIMKKPVTVNDLSAVVSGILLALNLPVTLPYWMAIIGCFVAIVLVKQMFGGIGGNFVNPALAARAFLLASWPAAMTTWAIPHAPVPLLGVNAADVITGATPLAILRGANGSPPDMASAIMGNIGGCIGETSVILILIGGLYLVFRKIIKWQIPAVFIATVFIMSFLFFKEPYSVYASLYQIAIGGVMLGAFFMATDYTTTPMTLSGHIVFAIGCGVITTVIRFYGGYPEGVSYSILLMNLVVPLIDKYMAPKRFGEVLAIEK